MLLLQDVSLGTASMGCSLCKVDVTKEQGRLRGLEESHIAMNKWKKIFQYSVLSRQPKGAKTYQGQSPFVGLIKRLSFWDIRQTNGVWWSERVTMAPQRSRPRMSGLMPPDHRIYPGSSCVIFLLPHSS